MIHKRFTSQIKAVQNVAKYTVLAISISALVGCAATQTVMEHGSLSAKTSLSKTIFLDPVSDNQKTIFIAVKNTSDENLDVVNPLKSSLSAHGYRVVNSPDKAHYMLQANILKIGKMSTTASQAALGGGYGSALAGGIAGAGVGALHGGTNAILTGGLVGGVAGLAADALVKDVNYSMITDVQISERVGKGVKVDESFDASLNNGTASSSRQHINRQTEFQRYRTRIVSNVDKVNLSYKTAKPALEQGLVKVLTGIF